jgi:hypothetical protein
VARIPPVTSAVVGDFAEATMVLSWRRTASVFVPPASMPNFMEGPFFAENPRQNE